MIKIIIVGGSYMKIRKGIFVAMICILAISITMAYCFAEAQTLFTEGFDDNNFVNRGWFDDTSVSLDTSVKYSGPSSLKLTWSSGGTGAAQIGAMRKDFTPTDSLYVSMCSYPQVNP